MRDAHRGGASVEAIAASFERTVETVRKALGLASPTRRPRGRPITISADKVAQVRAMLAAGARVSAISKALGISRGTVVNVRGGHRLDGVQAPPQLTRMVEEAAEADATATAAMAHAKALGVDVDALQRASDEAFDVGLYSGDEEAADVEDLRRLLGAVDLSRQPRFGRGRPRKA
jgi:transposase-like protein